MCASHWVVMKPIGAMKAKNFVGWLIWDPCGADVARRTTATSRPRVSEAQVERTCWDPKDGELCLSRTKPEETLVEVRSGSDVQIDRQTWV